ncbi:hypothetical protein AAFC00_000511 [Neodothiora populina]|uniref:Mediator complex subunit Med13 N-terminal domain-containing protein n=1 Tax=Neodothiora populina TaxID=2781224 RepID=A0ABR3PD42_9PEZI
MDFLKSCTTNLHAIEGYASIEYQIYTAPPSDHSGNVSSSTTEKAAEARPQPAASWTEERHAILLELRGRSVLVQSAAVQKKICVFGGFKNAAEYMKDLGWPLALTGRLDVSSLSRPGPDAKVNLTNQNIYGMFLSAVEESLTITLATNCRAMRVGHLTWIVPTLDDNEQEDAGVLAHYSLLTLRTQITAIGTLLLLPDAYPARYSTVSRHTDSDASLLLAPSGASAAMASDLSSLSARDGEPDTNKPRRQLRKEARARLAHKSREEAWKSSVKTRLAHAVGVPLASLDDSASWTRVRLTSQKPIADSIPRSPWDRPKPASWDHTCLWPSKLCFEKSDQSQPLSASDHLARSDSLSSSAYVDPLHAAEQWFLGKNARDEAAAAAATMTAQTEPQAMAERDPPTFHTVDVDMQQDQLSLSSPMNIRTQETSALNGVYPTPPDGIPPEPSTSLLPPSAPLRKSILRLP